MTTRNTRHAAHSLFLIPHSRIRAFTLIETALAMLAIGLGFMAVFGLGRLGLQSNKETLNDQRCVMMADAVFETLREYNARFIEEARTNTIPWNTLWDDALLNAPPIPFPLVANMSDDTSLLLHFYQPTETEPTPAYVATQIRLFDWNPRYRLYLSGKDVSPIDGAITAIQFTLEIYPDGNTYSSDYRLFHTTLSNSGGLP